jgi:thiamine-phosphate pyrophosphorylase
MAAPVVCVVTDAQRAFPDSRTPAERLRQFEAWLDAVAEARPDLLQLREPSLPAADLAALTARLVARSRGSACRVIVNYRADIALAAGADGVHLRADGPEIERVRALGSASWLVGRSVHSVRAAQASQHADYLIFGTVFPTPSKDPDAPVAGVGVLAETVAASGAPVIAIGGVDAGRAATCIAAGAAGVAGITIFFPEGRVAGALGPARAVAALRGSMGDARGAPELQHG